MNDFERRMRDALERQDPPEGFEERVMARLRAEIPTSRETTLEAEVRDDAPTSPEAISRKEGADPSSSSTGRRSSGPWLRMVGAMAAGALLTLVGVRALHQPAPPMEGARAKEELMTALRIASRKTNYARAQVQAVSTSVDSRFEPLINHR